MNEVPDSELGLNEILNIVLIVIGVLLILLAIAILIRLKIAHTYFLSIRKQVLLK